jgi:hypothetical protein
MAQRKVGRPVTIEGVETIGVRVGGSMAHDLHWLSNDWGCSVSDVVRRLIGHEIDILGLSNSELQSTRRRRDTDVVKHKGDEVKE